MNRKPRHGTIAVLNVAFHATGREIHIVNNAMRENNDTNAVKQPPELLRISTLLVVRHASVQDSPPAATATLATASVRRTARDRFVAATPLAVEISPISQNDEAVDD
jgi:hypothetical protein